MFKQTLWSLVSVCGLGLLGLGGCSAAADDLLEGNTVEVDTEEAALRAAAKSKKQAKATTKPDAGRRTKHGKAKRQSKHRHHHPHKPGHHGPKWGGGASEGGGEEPSSGSGGSSSTDPAGDDSTGSGGIGSGEGGGAPMAGAGGGYDWDDVCGDGLWGMNEYCDDGNVTSGDGCSASCQTEPGFFCEGSGEPCREVVCGDGLQDWYMRPDGYWTTEACDDGNQDAGDGCGADCEVEPGWLCQGSACRQPACGDGVADSGYLGGGEGSGGPVEGEPAPGDEGDVGGAGGASASGGSAGVAGGGGPTAEYYYEACDDGNVDDGDGCSAECVVESGWICSWDGSGCFVPVCGDGSVDSLWEPGEETADDDGMGAAGGGSGSYTHYEDCDDGNTVSGDGCSADCTVESGWVCSWDGSCRVPVCGDGYVDMIWGTGEGELGPTNNSSAGAMGDDVDGGAGGSSGGWEYYEACDDGNDTPGDGCTNCEYDYDTDPIGSGGSAAGSAGWAGAAGGGPVEGGAAGAIAGGAGGSGG